MLQNCKIKSLNISWLYTTLKRDMNINYVTDRAWKMFSLCLSSISISSHGFPRSISLLIFLWHILKQNWNMSSGVIVIVWIWTMKRVPAFFSINFNRTTFIKSEICSWSGLTVPLTKTRDIPQAADALELWKTLLQCFPPTSRVLG